MKSASDTGIMVCCTLDEYQRVRRVSDCPRNASRSLRQSRGRAKLRVEFAHVALRPEKQGTQSESADGRSSSRTHLCDHRAQLASRQQGAYGYFDEIAIFSSFHQDPEELRAAIVEFTLCSKSAETSPPAPLRDPTQHGGKDRKVIDLVHQRESHRPYVKVKTVFKELRLLGTKLTRCENCWMTLNFW